MRLHIVFRASLKEAARFRCAHTADGKRTEGLCARSVPPRRTQAMGTSEACVCVRRRIARRTGPNAPPGLLWAGSQRGYCSCSRVREGPLVASSPASLIGRSGVARRFFDARTNTAMPPTDAPTGHVKLGRQSCRRNPRRTSRIPGSGSATIRCSHHRKRRPWAAAAGDATSAGPPTPRSRPLAPRMRCSPRVRGPLAV